MRCIKLAVIVCGIVLLGQLGNSNSAHAQDGFNIVTSPLPINLHGAPGSTLTTDIRVKNGGLKTEKLKVTLMKFSAYGEEGKPAIKDREIGDDYFDWVTFSPGVFDAPPNEWMTIKMSIALPKSAAFGYYYAAVFSRATNPVPTSSKENVLVGSTAVLALVDAVVPGANRTASISSFTASKHFYEFLPADFNVKIRNNGNVHLVPTGNIFITSGGKKVATIDVNTAAGNVLPGSNRIFTTAWTDGFPVYVTKTVNGKTDTNLSWDFSKLSHLKFGHYNARLVMAYDNGTRDVPMEATVSFWVLPMRLILVGLAIPILPSIIVYLHMKQRLKQRKFKRRQARAKEREENT